MATEVKNPKKAYKDEIKIKFHLKDISLSEETVHAMMDDIRESLVGQIRQNLDSQIKNIASRLIDKEMQRGPEAMIELLKRIKDEK